MGSEAGHKEPPSAAGKGVGRWGPGEVLPAAWKRAVAAQLGHLGSPSRYIDLDAGLHEQEEGECRTAPP